VTLRDEAGFLRAVHRPPTVEIACPCAASAPLDCSSGPTGIAATNEGEPWANSVAVDHGLVTAIVQIKVPSTAARISAAESASTMSTSRAFTPMRPGVAVAEIPELAERA